MPSWCNRLAEFRQRYSTLGASFAPLACLSPGAPLGVRGDCENRPSASSLDRNYAFAHLREYQGEIGYVAYDAFAFSGGLLAAAGESASSATGPVAASTASAQTAALVPDWRGKVEVAPIEPAVECPGSAIVLASSARRPRPGSVWDLWQWLLPGQHGLDGELLTDRKRAGCRQGDTAAAIKFD